MSSSGGQREPERSDFGASCGTVGSAFGTEGRLRRNLSSFAVLCLTLSGLSPVFSIYGIGSDVFRHTGTGAAVLFLIGIAVALVWAAVHAELGSAFPYAGGTYVGIGSILGPWAAIVALASGVVGTGPAVASTANVMADYLGEAMPLALPSAFLSFASLAAALVIALLAVRVSAVVTSAFLAVEMVALLALIGVGAWHPSRALSTVIAEPRMLGESGLLVSVSFSAMVINGVSAAYASMGGDQAIYFGEELREPHRRIGGVIVTAGLIGALAIAVPVILVVLGANDVASLMRSPVPFTAFVSSVAGPAAGRALNAAVALAVFNALIILVMVSARFFFSVGRDEFFAGRVNYFLAEVHHVSGIPRKATWIVGIVSAGCCLLDTHTLLVLQAGSTSFGLALDSLAVIIGRSKSLTALPGYWRTPAFPVVPLLGMAVATGFFIADISDQDAGRPGIVITTTCVAIALVWYRYVLKKRPGGWAPRL